MRTVAETKCSVIEGAQNITLDEYPSEVKLNGSVVETINCDKLDQYTYPDISHGEFHSGPTVEEFLIFSIAPALLILSSGLLVSRKYISSRIEILKIAGISTSGLVSGAALVQLFTLSDTLTNLLLILSSIFGLLFPSLVTYSLDKGETLNKAKPVIALIFNIAYIWLILSLITLASQPLVV